MWWVITNRNVHYTIQVNHNFQMCKNPDILFSICFNGITKKTGFKTTKSKPIWYFSHTYYVLNIVPKAYTHKYEYLFTIFKQTKLYYKQRRKIVGSTYIFTTVKWNEIKAFFPEQERLHIANAPGNICISSKCVAQAKNPFHYINVEKFMSIDLIKMLMHFYFM